MTNNTERPLLTIDGVAEQLAVRRASSVVLSLSAESSSSKWEGT
jgi:hypothetical protein